jgi:diguanylate cyclase (GGDEF)-like protein
MDTQRFPDFPAADATAWAETLLAHARQARQPMSLKEIDNGRYAWVNEAMANLLGRPAAEIVGRSDAELLPATVWPALRTADQAAAAQGIATLGEHKIELSGGRREFSVVRLARPRQQGAPATHLCAVWTDLTETRQREAQLRTAVEQLEAQQQANEALRRQAHEHDLRDHTTGVYNQAHFDDQLRREIDLSSREHRQFALVSVELDPLNEAAAAGGLPARTRVLEALGRQLRDNTRAMDASCRYDDNRFAVLLSGVGLATAHSRMEGLRRQCATQIVAFEGRELGFTVSMGVASFPHTADTKDELVRAADAALAEARKRGGNHVALASIRFAPSI